MLRQLGKRLIASVIVLIAISIFSFALVRLDGADPARMLAGELASDQEVEDMRVRMGLDKPVVQQYLTYMNNVLHGDLGYSWAFSMPVSELFAIRIPQTLRISVLGILWACVFSIILGVIAGIHQGSGVDFFAMFFAVVGQSMSTVWLGFMLILIFAVKLGWLPVQGVQGARSLIMPCLCVGFGTAAHQTRLMRSGMVDVLREDYVTATRARGISRNKTYFKYALKNALLPIVTNIGGQIGRLVSGAVVVENIFNLPGMGQALITGINQRDYQLVQSFLLFTAALLVVCNMLADIVYTIIDPRITFN